MRVEDVCICVLKGLFRVENSGPLSAVIVRRQSPHSSLISRNANSTESQSRPSISRRSWQRVFRSIRLRMTLSRPLRFPTTVSISQCPNCLRRSTALGRSSILRPARRLCLVLLCCLVRRFAFSTRSMFRISKR